MFTKVIAAAATVAAVSAGAVIQQSGSNIVSTQYPSALIPLIQDQPTVAYTSQQYGHVAVQQGASQIIQGFQYEVPTGIQATSCGLDFNLLQAQQAAYNINTFDAANTELHVYSALGALNPGVDTWAAHAAQGAFIGSIQVNQAGQVLIPEPLSVPCSMGQTQAFYLMAAPTVSSCDLSWLQNELSPLNGLAYQMYL